jgi:hypothetical protein
MAIAFASVLGVPAGPSGQVAGIVGKPVDATERPTPPEAIAAKTAPTDRNGGTQIAAGRGSSNGTTTPQSNGSTPAVADPTPTSLPDPPSSPEPAPTPTPTRAPRPTPPPKPTPDPTATPCLAIAPQLTGERRNSAAAIWTQAGFSGRVTALEGHGNYAIATQSLTVGHEYPCDAGVTIGP